MRISSRPWIKIGVLVASWFVSIREYAILGLMGVILSHTSLLTTSKSNGRRFLSRIWKASLAFLVVSSAAPSASRARDETSGEFRFQRLRAV